MPFFSNIDQLPDDPILSIPIKFNADPRKDKINLGVGAYRDSSGNPLVLTSVRKAEKKIFEKELNKEYLPISGLPSFNTEIVKLLFGETPPHHFSTQTVGGSGALKVGGEFLYNTLPFSRIYLSNPTWGNHPTLFKTIGFQVEEYPYYDPIGKKIKFNELCEAITRMPRGSAILLHACCHNPTGEDLTEEQWKILSNLIRDYGIYPFFDIAYQGFGKGVTEDAFPIRHFYKEGHEMAIATSQSKNFGLYSERIGGLVFVTDSDETAKRVGSHIKHIIRTIYSSPPAHGARIVAEILQDPALRKEWEEELGLMRDRVHEMRRAMSAELLNRGLDFRFMEHQNGIFSLLGLSSEQVQRLISEHGLYLPMNGRINFAGLTTEILAPVASSLEKVLT